MKIFPVVAVLGVIGWSVMRPEISEHVGHVRAHARSSTSAQDFQWRGQIAAGNAIEIRGVNGDVRAMLASGPEVEVTAEKRAGRRGDPEEVTIEVLEHDGGVTVCAMYPSRRDANECRPGGGKMNVKDNDTQVRFTVRVPDRKSVV